MLEVWAPDRRPTADALRCDSVLQLPKIAITCDRFPANPTSVPSASSRTGRSSKLEGPRDSGVGGSVSVLWWYAEEEVLVWKGGVHHPHVDDRLTIAPRPHEDGAPVVGADLAEADLGQKTLLTVALDKQLASLGVAFPEDSMGGDVVW